MYTPLKNKHTAQPPSPTQYYAVRRLMPRHTKAYLWLFFLSFVFGLLLLSDHGVSVLDYLPKFGSPSTQPGRLMNVYDEVKNEVSSSMHYSPLPSRPTVIPMKQELHPEPLGLNSPVYGTGAKAFTPEDVVILFKTGATTLWRRVPMHLSTSLANKTMTPNIVFYSDQADSIAGQPIIDVLANVSTSLKQSDDFKLYRTLPIARSSNWYHESAGIAGDHWSPGGWRLDKYKFLPLAAHAAAYHPGKKWYIYMEDDNYYFWHSLYTWLGSNFSPSDPWFLGGPGAKLGEDFAHGGSGFMISGAALAQTFGSDPDLASKYESYATAHCCGDQVLSHVMAAKGVPRYRGYNGTSFFALQALQTWQMGFGLWNWCSPLFNIHKVHQADISRLYEFEKRFHSQQGYGSDAVMNWSYMFKNFVAQDIFHRNVTSQPATLTIPEETVYVNEWDNLAAEKWFTSDIAVDEHLSEEERAQKPWFSADACEKACEGWYNCMSWKFQDDNCGLSSDVHAGMAADEGVRIMSGYMGKRIKAMVDRDPCGRSKFVPES